MHQRNQQHCSKLTSTTKPGAGMDTFKLNNKMQHNQPATPIGATEEASR